ncbi:MULTISPECIES: hypothetical protein [unclassified Endozoicomonas]|uniref:hypothetical protein n=1 Tax=unclassified Endozoicomonas TaxID=2644528 RepID=UPI002147595F|nr:MULTISPECIES: hypothetical protein [unclassified Endozoicomonas]
MLAKILNNRFHLCYDNFSKTNQLIRNLVFRAWPDTALVGIFTTYPALFLMQPPDNIVLIRQGSISLTALTERIADVAYQQDWINKSEYQKTRITNEVWSGSLLPENINLFNKGKLNEPPYR